MTKTAEREATKEERRRAVFFQLLCAGWNQKTHAELCEATGLDRRQLAGILRSLQSDGVAEGDRLGWWATNAARKAVELAEEPNL